MAIGESAGLLFKIKGDSTDAVKAINDVQRESKDLTGAAGGLGEALSGLGGPGAIAAASVTAIAAAAIAGVRALFDLSKQAADFGSEIFDASVKTGLSAETLTALKFGAEQAGSSFEQVTKAATVLGVALGDAQAGSEKAIEKLKALGVTSLDSDEALAQIFKTINGAKTPTEALALATEAFGKKIGPDLIGLIKDTDGNLEGLIEKAKSLGVTIDDNAAAAADAFGDQLDLLNTQLAGVGRTIGFAVMPIFLEWATKLSEFLVRNQGEIEKWADRVARALRFVVDTIANNVDAFAGLGRILGAIATYDWTLAAEGVRQITNAINAQKQAYQTLTTPVRVREAGRQGIRSPEGLPDVQDKDDAEKRRKEREQLAQRDAAAQIQILKNQFKDALESYDQYNRQLEQKIKDGQTAGAGALGTLRANTLNAELQEILPQLEAAEEAQARSLKKTANEVLLIKQEQQERIEDVNKKQQEAQQRLNAAITDAEKKAAKESEDTAKQAAENRLRIRQAETERQVAQLDLELSRKAISEIDYIKRISAERIALLELERSGEDDKTKIAVLDSKIAEEKLKQIKAVAEAERELHEKRRKNWNEYVQNLIKIQEAEDKERERRQQEEEQQVLNTTVGSGQEISAFDQLRDHFAGKGMTAAVAGIDTLRDAFAGLGQAVGQVVQAWVLYGSAGASVRQVTAQILASLAQQAAVKAIFELGEGFAALALAFFGIPNAGPSATAHFTAAAIYGSIAGVAAVAGRAVAGDSFKKQAGAAGGSGGGGGAGPNMDPIQRTSEGAFTSGRGEEDLNPFQRAALVMERLEQKIESMSPGDVLKVGAQQERGFIGQTVVREASADSSIGAGIRRTSGLG